MIDSISTEEMSLISDNVYKKIVDMGYLEKMKDKKERVLQIRKMLNIPNLLYSKQSLVASGLFRKNDSLNCDCLALALWLKICEIETNKIDVGELNLSNIKNKLEWIKSLSVLDPNIFLPQITTFFANNGIALKVVKDLPNVPVHGYIQQDNNKTILCLTIRQSYADIFWFSLFHELGHLFSNNLKKKYVDFDGDEEKNADVFATEHLITKTSLNELLKNGINEKNIRHCANENNIDAGIVVGRLQHEKIIPYSSFYQLRKKYSWI